MAPSRPKTVIFSLKIEVRLGIYLGELGRWVLCQNFKVDLCTPARAVRHAGIPIGDFDRICQYFLITVDERNKYLLHEAVRDAHVEVQTGERGDRAVRVVGSNRGVVGFGYRRDFANLRKASAVADVRLDHVNRVGRKEWAELPAVVELFPGRDWHLHRACELRHRLDVVVENWLF